MGAINKQDGVGMWTARASYSVSQSVNLWNTVSRLVSVLKSEDTKDANGEVIAKGTVLKNQKIILDKMKDSIKNDDGQAPLTQVAELFPLMDLQTDQTIMPQL